MVPSGILERSRRRQRFSKPKRITIETRRRNRTRPVVGIAENTKLNRALWSLAAKRRSRESVAVGNLTKMHRLNKAKDARRRARKQQLKAIHAFGVAITSMRVLPDKRRKSEKHKKPLREES